MKSKKIFPNSNFILSLLFVAFLASCNNDGTIITIITKWNESHNKQNITAFDSFYADEVNYYGKELSKNKCIQDKLKLFDKYKEYRQEIENIDIKASENLKNSYTVNFSKKVFFDGKTRIYPSYLTLIKKGNQYLISGENDKITDKKLGIKKNKSKSKKDKPISNQNPYKTSQIHTLTGILISKKFERGGGFGSPNASKYVHRLILKLKNPIEVHVDKTDYSHKEIEEIQLVMPDNEAEQYLNKDIIVTGELYEADNGNHYTQILIFVNSYKEK